MNATGLLLLLLAAPAFAAFEEKGVGARAPGLGNAFAAIAGDVYAAQYNPAGRALGLVGSPWLGALLSRPVGALAEASRRLGEGERDAAAPVRGSEELLELGREFNAMAGKLRERIFTKFYRAAGPGGRPQRTPGSGLGLTIAKQAVDLHGGRIWVESVVGKQSVFHVPQPTSWGSYARKD